MSSKGISPRFATLVLIAIAVIAGIVVYMFVSGTLNSMQGPSVKIFPDIYSQENNVGILNQEATFIINVKNPTNSSLSVKVSITGDGNSVLVNSPHIIAPNGGNNIEIKQKLSYTGFWLIKATTEDGLSEDSYSFAVYTSKVDADLYLTSLNREIARDNNSFYALIISIVALIIATIVNGLTFYVNNKKLKKIIPYND